MVKVESTYSVEVLHGERVLTASDSYAECIRAAADYAASHPNAKTFEFSEATGRSHRSHTLTRREVIHCAANLVQV